MDYELPSGTVTLLFTDIEGSTRLIEEIGEEAYVQALTQHRRALREAFTAASATQNTPARKLPTSSDLGEHRLKGFEERTRPTPDSPRASPRPRRAPASDRAAEFAEARRYYEEALALYQQEGGLLGEAKAELQIGECAIRLQQLDAREHLQHALVCLRDLAERSSLPETLEELAAAHLEKRPSAAATLLGSAERLRSEIGAPRWEPTYYEETLHRVRTVLGDAFGDAWAEGLTMDEEAVLEYALSIG